MMLEKKEKIYNMIDLKGKNAIVTGAGNGIGYEITRQFKDAGARVIGVDLSINENKKF